MAVAGSGGRGCRPLGPSLRAACFDTLYHGRGVALVVPWILWLGCADVALSLLLPFRPLAPNLVYDASSAVAWTVWAWVQNIFESRNGARVETSGDAPLPPGESAVVVANHVAWSDFYLIQSLARKSGMLSRCRWFAKSELRAVPFLGWGLWAMGMPLVSRNWTRDRRELDRVFYGVVTRKWPTWLISFSEATRFSRRKYAESEEWCQRNRRTQPRHLLYPRTKGFVATVQHLRQAEHIRAVYDLTLAYYDGTQRRFQAAPQMWDTLRLPSLSGGRDEAGQGFRFHIHVRRFPIDKLPHTDEELAAWLEQRWIEKGEWLEKKRQEWAVE